MVPFRDCLQIKTDLAMVRLNGEVGHQIVGNP